VPAGDESIVGGRLPDTPLEEPVGTGANLALAGLDLVPELAGIPLAVGHIVAVAAGLDDSEEVPAEVGLGLGREGDGDDRAGPPPAPPNAGGRVVAEGGGEEGGEPRANAGGIDNQPGRATQGASDRREPG